MGNKFLIITCNNFPKGDAGAIRLSAFASILLELKYEPYVICMGQNTNFEFKENEGVYYCSLRYGKKSFIYRVGGRVLFDFNLKKIIYELEDVKGILIDSGMLRTFGIVKKYVKERKIPLIYDSVEWYSASEFSWGKLNPAYIHNNLINRSIINHEFKVIAISSYLEHYFQGKGLECIQIPVIMDMNSKKTKEGNKHKNDENKIKIVYAGSIGKKDRIKELVKAVEMLGEQEQNKIYIYLMGITKEQYEKHFGKVCKNILNKCIKFMGRVERNVVLTYLSTADFSFLLRPAEERYARAGFPTKVVEGLSMGVPLLCNYSSDLNRYLIDEENSIIIEDCSSEACLKALKRIVSLNESQLDMMKIKARECALENFAWELYIEKMKNFIS